MKFIKDHLLQYKARSRQHFFDLIRDNGMSVQYTKGVPTGVLDSNGKSYSWQKLGITPADFYALDHRAQLLRIDERLQKLEQLRAGKQPERDMNP